MARPRAGDAGGGAGRAGHREHAARRLRDRSAPGEPGHRRRRGRRVLEGVRRRRSPRRDLEIAARPTSRSSALRREAGRARRPDVDPVGRRRRVRAARGRAPAPPRDPRLRADRGRRRGPLRGRRRARATTARSSASSAAFASGPPSPPPPDWQTWLVERLFDPRSRAAAPTACRSPTSRSRHGCGPRPWASSSARSTCSAGLRAADRDRGGTAALDGPLRAAGTGKTTIARFSPRRECRLRGALGRQRRPRRGPRGDRARRAPAPDERRADGPVPRRDPPLQQGAAGHAAAGGRGGARRADRRDDGEPLLRGQLGAPLAHAASTSCAASATTRSGLLRRALADERGIAEAPPVDDEALEFLAARAGGDARTALSALELACETAGGEAGDAAPRRRRPPAQGRPLRQGRRPPLRHDLGLDQGDARLRPGRVAPLPRGDARGRRGSALHRAADGDPRQRGHRQRRPARAPGGGRGGAGRRARRAAGGRPQPLPGGALPRAGAEVERLARGDRPRAPGFANMARRRYPRICAAPPIRARRRSAAARATTTRTTGPRASPSRS